MSARASKSAIHRYRRDYREICPTCKGAGTTTTKDAISRSTKGGNASHRKSLEEGQLSMTERGRMGGAPTKFTIWDIQNGTTPLGPIKIPGALPNKGEGA